MKEREVDRRAFLGLAIKGGAGGAFLAALGLGVKALLTNPELASNIKKKLPGLAWLSERENLFSPKEEERGEVMTQEEASLLVLKRAIADLELSIMTNGDYWNMSSQEQEEFLKRWDAFYQRVTNSVRSGRKEWWSADLWNEE